MEPIDLTEQLGRWSAGRGPLYVLLAARLRRLIDDGDLPPGTALPPDRVLAAALAVGRSTVVAAYDLLRQDGRIARKQGSGTHVAGAGPAVPHDTTSAPVFLHLLEPNDDVLLLACAAPDTPPPELAEAYARILPELAATAGGIGYQPAGHDALRRAIAERYTGRGIPTGPEQILVTNGGQQALSLIARAYIRPGDRVLTEAPTYPGALEAFREEGAVLRGLPVGLDGFEAAARQHRPALAYVIPVFQNPTGTVLAPLAGRRLVEAADAAGVPLIDDEVLADLGFPGVVSPLPLAAYGDSVISVGSLSKVVWGGLRIGWVRAPVPVITRLARLRAVHDLGGNIPAQLAAASLMPHLGAMCRRQAAERLTRHDHLRAELARQLPGWDAPPAPGGQTLWVRLPRGDSASFAQTALRHGVAVLPGVGLDASGHCEDYLRLQFLLPQAELSRAAQRLAQAWHAYVPPADRTGAAAALAV
jgi:DNA-binding transcriptional MocR family regulator